MSRLAFIVIVLPLALCLGAGNAEAANTPALCKKFRDSLVMTPAGMAQSDFKAPKFELLTVDIGNAHIGNMQLKVQLEGALVDIENRGAPDRVLLAEQMMRGTDAYNDLYVLRVDPFGTKKEITVQSLAEIADNGMAVKLYGYDGLLSGPYGITIPSLSLVSIANKNYLMIQQNAVTDTPPLVLLATYSASQARGDVQPSSGLDVVCAVHPHFRIMP